MLYSQPSGTAMRSGWVCIQKKTNCKTSQFRPTLFSPSAVDIWWSQWCAIPESSKLSGIACVWVKKTKKTVSALQEILVARHVFHCDCWHGCSQLCVSALCSALCTHGGTHDLCKCVVYTWWRFMSTFETTQKYNKPRSPLGNVSNFGSAETAYLPPMMMIAFIITLGEIT